MSYRDIVVLKCKNLLEKCLLRILLHILSFAWAPSTSSSFLRSSKQAKRCGPSFFCFFPRAHMGRESRNTYQKFGIVFHFFNICTWNYFTSLFGSFMMFSNCARKHRKRDVKTVFTYSHLNSPIDQWERAYNLNYFIKWLINQYRRGNLKFLKWKL